jgi:hypothetical protein
MNNSLLKLAKKLNSGEREFISKVNNDILYVCGEVDRCECGKTVLHTMATSWHLIRKSENTRAFIRYFLTKEEVRNWIKENL